jgi:wobble nucleotide-excising tRNase
MISRLRLIRNIGQFNSVSPPTSIVLRRLTLIFAENGRGKTTLSAILGSLNSGDPIPIRERRRLAATHPPHVILELDDNSRLTFENDTWSGLLSNISVFDDSFVDNNICSGLTVGAHHRQNLHSLILGSQGVHLNRELQQHVRRIEEHNSIIRTRTDAIPDTVRRGVPIDDFCAMEPRPEIDAEITAAERALDAAREQDPIRSTPVFDVLALPAIDEDQLSQLLQRDLSALDTRALSRLHEYFAQIGPSGEAWVSEGMSRIISPEDSAQCPFCAQPLAGSLLIDSYRAYFTQEYTGLKSAVSDQIASIRRIHGGDSAAAFERTIRQTVERQRFWSRFCDIPPITLDTAELARSWRSARDTVLLALHDKQAAPLEPLVLSEEARSAIAHFNAQCADVTALSHRLQAVNGNIRTMKEQTASADPAVIESQLGRLRAAKARHTPEIAGLCAAYLAAKDAKSLTEEARDATKEALEQHRETIFASYHTAINEYLRRFNADFALGQVTSRHSRSGPTCSYTVLINNTVVPVLASSTPSPGNPSFRSTLSSGDRNTLALAFFFASIDRDPRLSDKIVVIDDPITSLDDHRSLTTVQEIRQLVRRVRQVIVLSHSKPLLCRTWEDSDVNHRTALQLIRDRVGSTICTWDVSLDATTEHDRRHALLREYLLQGSPNNREVARSIRLLLEAFLRVACPEYFPPETLLGRFQRLCEQKLGTPEEILTQDDTRELGEILEYANRFHHDTNPAYGIEPVNDAQLVHFIRRALAFAAP